MEFLVKLDVTSTGLFRCVRGFYFLFCCVEVSSVVLCLLCCVVLRCVAIRCVAVVLYLLSCIALCCIVIRCVVLRCDPLCCVCLVLCCVVDKFSISSIPSMLKLYISRHTQPTSLTGRRSLHQRTRQTQPPLPNR